MSPKSLIRHERPADAPRIEALQHAAFGPGAYTRAAFRVREQAPHLPALSYLAEVDGELIGSVRMTPISVGGALGLLLGPLVVEPAHKGQGYGKALMRHVMEEARLADWPYVLLVGDLPYYWPFGFRPILPPHRIEMPGPVDPGRFLYADLVPGAVETLSGMVKGVTLGAAAGRHVVKRA
jgi:predicted N-acetyltransferase YhbS